MNLRRVTPRLETYLGREVPERLAERVYREQPCNVLFHGEVSYKRKEETYAARRTTRPGPCPNYLDVWTRGARRFSHWMFDMWPRLLVARELGLTRHQIIINSNPDPYTRVTLEALGIEETQLVRMHSAGLDINPMRLWRVEDARIGMWTPHWVIEAVREHFLAPAPTARRRRLYISRNRAERRRTINEGEVLALLEPMGFETLYLEEIPLREAAQIFNQAELVVAPHGAGVANIVFCELGCRVIEYFSWHISQEYWMLCQAMGLDYAVVEGEGGDGRRHYELRPEERNNRGVYSPEDIRVPIPELKRAILG